MDNNYEIKKLILDKIKEYDTIIIHRHFLPDGDCFGSTLGLRDIIRQSFPEKKVYSVGTDTVDYLEFVGKEDSIPDSTYENALVIVVDTSTSKRINGDSYKLGKEIIKIDHHLETDPYGDINYVLDYVASTTLIITDFLRTFSDELKISVDGARALYVGIVTDTGRFRYRSVRGKSLELAGYLLDYGFDTEEMYASLYTKEANFLYLQGYLLQHFKITKNGVAYAYLSKRIQKRFNASTSNASALVNCLDGIVGSLIWILFVQGNNGDIRARLRSRYTEINNLAGEFDGGGHAQASGAKVKNKSEIKTMVRRADELLGEYKENNKGWK
jgi:phosphoesterase RecJ-like protein